MVGYIFTLGVDGFGADIAPANDLGFFLDFEKAMNKLIELNTPLLQLKDCDNIRDYAERWRIEDIENKTDLQLWEEIFLDIDVPPLDYYGLETVTIIE